MSKSSVRLLFGWPGPLWLFPLVSVLMAVASFFATRSQLAGVYSLWASVSGAWHESLWLSGAGLAAGAALIGAVFVPHRGSPAGAANLARLGPGLPLRHGSAMALWALAGHAVGLLPVHLEAWRHASWGGVSLSDVAIGVAGIFALVLLGYSAGLALQHWAAAGLVGLLSFVVMALPSEPLWRPLGLVLPVRQFVAQPRFEVSTSPAVFNVLAAVALCLAAAHGAMWLRTRRTVRRSGRSAAAWGIAVVALTGTAFLWRPETYVLDRPLPSTCQDVNGIEVCLHKANAPALPEASRTVRTLQAAGLGPVLQLVVDEELAEGDVPPEGEAWINVDPGPWSPRSYTQSLPQDVAATLTSSLILSPCYDADSAPISTHDTHRALYRRVLQLAGYDQLVRQTVVSEELQKATERLGPSQIGSLLDTYSAETQSCSLDYGMVAAAATNDS